MSGNGLLELNEPARRFLASGGAPGESWERDAVLLLKDMRACRYPRDLAESTLAESLEKNGDRRAFENARDWTQCVYDRNNSHKQNAELVTTIEPFEPFPVEALPEPGTGSP